MAVWYCNYGNGTSTGYYAVAQWAALTSYSIGDLRRQLAAPSVGSERVFRCTTAGTSLASEPSWNLTKGATTTEAAGPVWTEVTGNSTYGWTAPHARLQSAASSGWPAAGDTVYLSNNHAETQSAAMTITSVGTAANPLSIICVNDGATPPTARATTATVSTTGASTITTGGMTYCYGVSFSAGSGSSTASWVGGGSWFLKNSNITLNNTSASSIITASTGNAFAYYSNVVLAFGAVGQSLAINSTFIWRDTANAIGGTVPTTLFTGGITGTCFISGVDLSAAGSGKTLFGAYFVPQIFYLCNCKLGASVVISATQSNIGAIVEVINCDSADTNYRYAKQTFAGAVVQETTIVRSSGSSDGTTPISYKFATSANSKHYFPLYGPWINFWNDTTGSSITVKAEVVTDNVTLTDAEAWIEVEADLNGSFPISTTTTDQVADPIFGTPANQTTSAVTWTTTGLTTPVKQTLSVSITPQEKGPIRARVVLAKPSTTMYSDLLVRP